MEIDWELREAGPRDAERTVLLLPGGMCSAGSYAEVMAESALAAMRLIAATMPGHRCCTFRSRAGRRLAQDRCPAAPTGQP